MEQPWSGRKLHFVGIGGAGMSGLAVVAHALGAERHRLRPRRRLAVRGDAARGGHRAARSATTPPTSPRAPRSSTRARSRPTNPERRAPGDAPRRPARRDHAPEADDRRLRHPRQDDDLEHARARAGRRPLPGRRRGPQHRRQRRLGAGGVARGRGRRVRPQPAQALADDRGRHQRRARPPHDLLLRSATSTTRSAPSWRSRANRSCRRSSCGSPSARRSSSEADVELARARRAQRAATPRAALTAIRLAGGDVAAAADAAGELRGRGAALRAARRTRRTAPLVVDDYAHHPTEVARDDRGRAHARAPARDRLLPAAPVLAHAARGDRVRPARSPPPTWPSILDVYPARETRRTSPASPACSSPRRPPTRAAASASSGRATTPPPSASCATKLCTGDLLLTMGAGDVDSRRPGAHIEGTGGTGSKLCADGP